LTLPSDYLERVYAGVLGKIIGVYLGRPFEGWSYERIMAELGEIRGYVHERLGMPLIVTDDDISGTFTFIRALADYGFSREITPAQIGQAWLNYLIENKTILWWGGLGRSTEHTAYLRLKAGVPAPHSGSAALNGKIVAEQIGAQIFIDGWAMVAPGDPDLAADLARRAASVSHDGEAIYGAQALAVMESLAFVEHDRQKLIEAALTHIPNHSTIYRMIQEIREQHAAEPDWRKTRAWFDERYGYGKYIGGCHIVPNHGLILLGLLYGDDDFQKSLMVVNTAGWDTDCNSGNLGCLMGIKNGLAGIDASPVDWRGPLADRLYNAAADGGRVVSDAVLETYAIANAGRALAGLAPLRPKGGARFHFSLPGSLQSFQTPTAGADYQSRWQTRHSLLAGQRERARARVHTDLPPPNRPGHARLHADGLPDPLPRPDGARCRAGKPAPCRGPAGAPGAVSLRDQRRSGDRSGARSHPRPRRDTDPHLARTGDGRRTHHRDWARNRCARRAGTGLAHLGGRARRKLHPPRGQLACLARLVDECHGSLGVERPGRFSPDSRQRARAADPRRA
jgi:ADP-ribosylglycohydrolase